MPLVQDDPTSGLNNFIDVANKDDHNPIVVAARQLPRSSSILAASSHRNDNTKSRRVSIAGTGSVCSEPDLENHKRASLASSTYTTYDDKNQSVRTGRFQGHFDDVDFNETSRGVIQNEDSGHSRRFSSNTQAENEEYTMRSKGAANLRAISEARFFENDERINYLEQEMAKLSFELAEARSQADWYRMQHRHLHLEFEDLQSYCNQLQDENKALNDGIIARKKKTGWFRSDQTRRLNQSRRRIDYKSNGVDSSQDPPYSCRDETSLARGREEDDWDADTLTTNFGGTSRHGEESTNEQSKGPLITSGDCFHETLEGSKNSGKQSDDTPKAITVTSREAISGEAMSTMDDLKDTDGAWYDSIPSATGTSQTDVESRNRDEPSDRKSHSGSLLEHTNHILGKLMLGSTSKTPTMNRVDIDGEQSVVSTQTAITTKTMPNIGWNLQGRRSSFVEKHRFVPTRRGSGLDAASTHGPTFHSTANVDFQELDFADTSDAQDTEAHASEVCANSSPTDKNDGGDVELKSWWTKVKLNTPFGSNTKKAEHASKQTKELLFEDDDCGKEAPDEPIELNFLNHRASDYSDGASSDKSFDIAASDDESSVEMPYDLSAANLGEYDYGKEYFVRALPHGKPSNKLKASSKAC